ncbi:hypothetical protein BH10PSE4_BH10PSE4_08790 [soil metagenome]
MTTVYLDRPATFDGDMSLQPGAQKNWLVSIFSTSSGYAVQSLTADEVILKVSAAGYEGYTVVLKPATAFSPSTNGLDPFYGAVVSVELHAADGSLVSTVEDLSSNTYLYQLGNYGTIAAAGSQIIGSDGADTIWAFNAYGGYAVDGGAGDDILYGGRQVGYDGYADMLAGGAGDDRIYGLGGDDDIVGGDGADIIDAGAGTDFVYLVEPTHHIDVYLNTVAPAGAVRVDNAEVVLLGDHGAFVQGAIGVDAVLGGLGADEIHGGAGDDLIAGFGGADKLYGDAGDDFFDGGEGDDLLDGGAGDDSVDLSAAFVGVTVNLGLTGGQDTGQGFDTFVAVENLYGTPYDDHFTGAESANQLTGDVGDDTLSGAGGDDTLNGDAGDDLLDGGAGADMMVGGYGDDTYVVGEAGDTVVEDSDGGDDTVRSTIDYRLAVYLENLVLDGIAKEGRGNELANVITGNAAANNLYGGAAADTLNGAAGADLLIGGLGADRLTGGGGRDVLQGTLAELNGDIILDFRVGDAINITDLSPADLVYARTATGVVLNNGATITLAGPSNGLVVTSNGAGGALLTVETRAASLGDFNGDGRADLAWRGVAGTLTTWNVDLQYAGAPLHPNVFVTDVGVQWRLVATADFNGDGTSDLMFRDAVGLVDIWASAGGAFAPHQTIVAGVPSDWQVASVGDFNGDGKSDLIWRHASGLVTEWLGDGAGADAFVQNVYIQGGVDNSWRIASEGDFNGDGKDDLIWRSTEGYISEWLSTGTGFTPNAFLDFSVDKTWHLVATADFSGDGKEDLLWRNDSGVFTEWRSNGAGFDRNVYVNGGVDNSWKLEGAGDFDGDGKEDLLWRHDASGVFSIWASTGDGFAPNVLVDGSVSAAWQIATNGFDLI